MTTWADNWEGDGGGEQPWERSDTINVRGIDFQVSLENGPAENDEYRTRQWVHIRPLIDMDDCRQENRKIVQTVLHYFALKLDPQWKELNEKIGWRCDTRFCSDPVSKQAEPDTRKASHLYITYQNPNHTPENDGRFIHDIKSLLLVLGKETCPIFSNAERMVDEYFKSLPAGAFTAALASTATAPAYEHPVALEAVPELVKTAAARLSSGLNLSPENNAKYLAVVEQLKTSGELQKITTYLVGRMQFYKEAFDDYKDDTPYDNSDRSRFLAACNTQIERKLYETLPSPDGSEEDISNHKAIVGMIASNLKTLLSTQLIQPIAPKARDR